MDVKVKIGNLVVSGCPGVFIPLDISLKSACHWLVVGSTGSGKTVLLLYILRSLLNSPIRLFIADFKGSGDFIGLSFEYAEFEDCVALIERFYECYQNIKQNRTGERILLIFDEYAGFLIWLEGQDKKKAAEIKNKIAEILMQGRSLPGNGSAWFWSICQRGDSSYFSYGSRDNYMVKIGMGRLSKESKGMLFPGEEIPENYIPATGKGLILEDGKELRVFQVPQIDKHRLKKLLQKMAEPGAGEAGGRFRLT